MESVNTKTSDSGKFLAERESWIEHRGKRILFRDYTGLTGEDAKRIPVVHTDAVVRRGERGLRVLLDVRGARPDKEAIEIIRKESVRAEPYTTKAALIGVKGILKLFFKVVTVFNTIPTKTFNSKEEALDWLASD